MYKVVIKKSAIKELGKLPLKEAIWLSEELKLLSENPRPSGCKKLKSFENKYRLRVGNYRAIYNVEDGLLIVEVISVGHRKDIY